MYYWVIFIAFFTALLLKLLAFLVFSKKKSEFLHFLEKEMPLLIMSILVIFLYKDLPFSQPPYAIDYILCGFLALIFRMIFKNSIISIILSTVIFMGLHNAIY